jgi:hypothetical protein
LNFEACQPTRRESTFYPSNNYTPSGPQATILHPHSRSGQENRETAFCFHLIINSGTRDSLCWAAFYPRCLYINTHNTKIIHICRFDGLVSNTLRLNLICLLTSTGAIKAATWPALIKSTGRCRYSNTIP